MPRQAKLCKRGDGNKHYAKGYCQACYMKFYRNGGQELTPEDENREDADLETPTLEELDDFLNAAAARDPRDTLAVRERETDTDGIKLMRKRLAGQLYLARREVVRQMLFDGLEPWQIKNEFLTRDTLYKTFVLPLKDPDRTLEEDMETITKSGRLKPLERYIDGLKRSLRRANAFADDSDLSARERSSWAKSADEIQRNLGIIEKAIHVVPGRGDIPVTEFDDEDGEEEEGPKAYRLPNVEEEEEEEEDDAADQDSE